MGTEKLGAEEFFVKGWKGDEAEEVDICSSEEDGASFDFGNEEGVGEVGGDVGVDAGGDVGSQHLGKRKRTPSPSGSSISRDTGPSSPRQAPCKHLSAREYRKSFYMSTSLDKKAGVGKGKERTTEHTTDEETSTRRSQHGQCQRDLKRKQIALDGDLSSGPSVQDLRSRNLCTWNTQWVCCCRCKKWRRIPYDMEVDVASWECKDNEWSALHASCDYPQDVPLRRLNETIEHACALSVDLSTAATHVTGSSLDEQLDSGDNISHGHASKRTASEPSEPKEIDKPEAVASSGTLKVPKERRCKKCGMEGKILSCSLCESNYHINCLEASLLDPVAQGWHCESCSNRTGLESLYLCADNENYVVKWKGRGHVHNSTLTEAELTKLAPKKLAILKKRGKVRKWDPSWAEPQRFIAKRETESQQTEWLVKWKGLGYEECTWEPADSEVCASENGLLLAGRYGLWCQAAGDHTAQALKSREKPGKLSVRPEWMRDETMEQHQLEMLNKLRDCWFDHKEGIVLCKLNLEQMVPILAFIVWLCRESSVSQPILMVMPAEMLLLWEKKIAQWQPDLNAVVFHGSLKAREVIREYEFDLIEGRPKFNIIISTSDSVISALDLLNNFVWSALFVDEGHVKVGKCFFKDIGLLQANFRLVFSTLYEPCKNNVPDLLPMLAFIDRKSYDGSSLQLPDVTEKLQERVVYKSTSSTFKEFWVPVLMSPVQMHRYCETLVEHYELLRSGNVNQGDAHLQNVVQQLQSCCCHPYIGTEKMIKSVEEVAPPEDYLRLGIKVSGKLELLHRLLLQYHSQKKTVLILLQSNSSQLRNILDDYLRQQFGTGSYVRIERRMDASGRQSALREFNEKASGRFAILLDRNAPVQYQLGDVDAVFIYESDWNPWNDTSYIQSLGIASTFRIYRLYICRSLEEKALLYAREGAVLNNLRNMNAKRFQEMLQWGAKVLFEIDDWNLKSGAATDARIGWEGVIEELALSLRKELVFLSDTEVQQLATFGNEPTTGNEKIRSILSPREPSAKGSPLYGVPVDVVLDATTSAETFWSRLLKDKHAQQMNLNEPTRLRKRERANESGCRKKPKVQQQCGIQTVEVVGGTADNTALPDFNSSPGLSSPEALEENSPVEFADEPMQEDVYRLEEATIQSQDASGAKSMREKQEDQLDAVKREMKLLCDLLNIPAKVFERAEKLHDFAAKNLRMNHDYLREVELSLCWIAAEQLDVNFNLSEAVSVASRVCETAVDEGTVAAVCSKLKEQLSVSLPEFFKSVEDHVTGSSEVQKSPEQLPPGRVQGEVDAAVLESKRKHLIRLRSQRRMKLLDSQKAEWCKLVSEREQEIYRAKQVCKMECQYIELSDEPQYQKYLKLTERRQQLNSNLKGIEERHSKEKQILQIRQRSSRELESCVIASHMKGLENGYLPGPLPELILPEILTGEESSPVRSQPSYITIPRAEQESQTVACEKESSLKIQPEACKVNSPAMLEKCSSGQVSQPEEIREDLPRERSQINIEEPPVPQEQQPGPTGQESVEENIEVIAGAPERNVQPPERQQECQVNESRTETILTTEQQQSVEIHRQPEQPAYLPQLDFNGPQRQEVRTEGLHAAECLLARSSLASATQRQTQVYTPPIVSTGTVRQTERTQPSPRAVPQQTQAIREVQSQRSASTAQVETQARQAAPQRQTETAGASARSQMQTQHVVQRQTQQLPSPAQPVVPVQSQVQSQHEAGGQTHQFVPSSGTQNLSSSGAQSEMQTAAGPVRQGMLQDPLANEEAKLQKERERMKKMYQDEVTRVNTQYKLTLENLQRNFRQRDESLNVSLQKAGEQRRLADALRKKDHLSASSPRRQAKDSSVEFAAQPNPSVPFLNSMPAFPQPTQIPVQHQAGTLPFMMTGMRPVSPIFLNPAHPGTRDHVVTPRLDQQQSSQSFAAQNQLGAATQATQSLQPQLVHQQQVQLQQQQQVQLQQQHLQQRNESPLSRLQQQSRGSSPFRIGDGPGAEQLRPQPQARSENVSPHLRNAAAGNATGTAEQATSLRLNHHLHRSPSLDPQLRLQPGGQRQVTAAECTAFEQLRNLQQQARMDLASHQLRMTEQHSRVPAAGDGRGSEQAGSQFRVQQQGRASRVGEWPPMVMGTSPVPQARYGAEQQQPSPHFQPMVQMQQQQQVPFGSRPPAWNGPQQLGRLTPGSAAASNHLIINNNIVHNTVNTGAVAQAHVNELRASSQNMYTSISRQIHMGTANMFGYVPARPPVQQQLPLQHPRQPQYVQLPLDGPAVMSERDYIYLSDDE